MAGKRQHFIPRFLQEGFASHFSGDSAYIWVFRSGRPPYNTNAINSGVEGQFYTQNGDTSVDDHITAAEAAFASLVKKLKTIPAGVVSEPKIPELIAHLEVRTRHLRQSFLEREAVPDTFYFPTFRICSGRGMVPRLLPDG